MSSYTLANWDGSQSSQNQPVQRYIGFPTAQSVTDGAQTEHGRPHELSGAGLDASLAIMMDGHAVGEEVRTVKARIKETLIEKLGLVLMYF